MLVPAMLSTQAWIKCAVFPLVLGVGGLGRSRPWLCPRETDKHQLHSLPT